jgi:hypothetical protein
VSLAAGFYRATLVGLPDQLVLLDYAGRAHALDAQGGVTIVAPELVTDARPLLWLDLSDWMPQQVLNLPGWLRGSKNDKLRNSGFLAPIADQIEEQVGPAPIPEPVNIGALFTARQVGEGPGSDRVWVRFNHARDDCWIDSFGHIRSWSELTRVGRS